MNMGSGTVK